MRFATIAEFAAQRRGDQDSMEKDLFPTVSEALQVYPATNWYADLLAEVTRAYIDTYHREGGRGRPHDLDKFVHDVRDTLDKTENPDDNTADRLSTWLATAILNAATMEATGDDEEFAVLEWVTMHDDVVREAHRDTDGQQRPAGEPFDVAGSSMRYPGDPTAPIELWINCRCALAPVPGSEAAAAHPTLAAASGSQNDTGQEADMSDDEMTTIGTPVPWHGVLAPEGVWSGDKRMFTEGSLGFRTLPIPLTWQKATSDGHDGSIVVAKIERIARVGNEMRADGHFLTTVEADEAIGLVSEFGRYGVSVDADNAEYEFDDEAAATTFTSARISSASLVSIPAFAEAFVALGQWVDGEMPDHAIEGEAECDPTDPNGECYDPATVAPAAASIEFVSDKPWSNFTAADYTDEQWYSACVLHKNGSSRAKSDNGLPIKEPGGALNRNGVHAAAARFNQVQAPAAAKAAAKAKLRSAYSQIGEEPPDVLKATASDVAFGRGPGWITNPVATKRIHDYWTVPGEEGYAKIGWGTPGDFDRCRVEIGQEIAEQDPATVARFMNQICAQWHHDATGFWPGHAPAERVAATGEPAPALSLVAAGGWCAPSEWFGNPGFAPEDGRMVQQRDGSWACPLTITEEGRVFGHLASWRTCHTAYEGTCVAPPRSATEYAYFLTGEVLTDKGAIPVGQITMDTGHAAPGSFRKAISHYDNTGTVVCDVNCGEDEYGIWLAGWVRPGVAEEKVVGLRASTVSGDWRRISQASDDLELIGALAVNSGGFPIPRVGVQNAVQVSLVAAGVVTDAYRMDSDTFAEMVAQAVERRLIARQQRRERVAELAARVHGGGQ